MPRHLALTSCLETGAAAAAARSSSNQRLLAQKTFDSKRGIVLDVAGECSDEVGANLVESVRRYCELAIRRADRQHDLIWRQGMRSLVSGSPLFVVGIGLSYLFTRPFVGEFAGELFGNGVFLVVACRPVVPARCAVYCPGASKTRGQGAEGDPEDAGRRSHPQR